MRNLSWGWRWAFVPLLALVAYCAALGIGFLSDDFLLLYGGLRKGFDFESLLPSPLGRFYRPVGTLLTWELGWQVWGLNPLPYHLISLLSHALTALVLGLWLSDVTSKRGMGWLAGAIFVVFPLHLEAVGWLAAQWDALAVLFTLSSLWLFSAWWKRGARARQPLYALSLLLYTLGVFTKESVLLFLPIFPLSAWMGTRERGKGDLRRLALWLLPYLAALALNLGIRVSAGGYMGGLVGGGGAGYSSTFWDHLILYARLLLSPVSAVTLGNVTAQVVGALMSLALFVGLVMYGRSQRYILLLVGMWLTLSLAPVLGFTPRVDDLQENRLLYLASGGYCAGVAALAYAAIASVARWRPYALGLLGTTLLLSIAACWAQLLPWHVASAQVEGVGAELRRLIPTLGHNPYGATWYVQNIPDSYKGAYVLRLGLGSQRYFTAGELPLIEPIGDATAAPLTTQKGDAFALRFAYNAADMRYYVDYASGISSAEGQLPQASEGSGNLTTWDFRSCAPDVLEIWEVANAQYRCEMGRGLILQPDSDDMQMVGPAIALRPTLDGARFLRLRVSAHYVPTAQPGQQVGQWYWKGEDSSFSEDRSRSIAAREDGQAHVYWTFIPTDEAGENVTGLRFDPTSSALPVELGWVAVDWVK